MATVDLTTAFSNTVGADQIEGLPSRHSHSVPFVMEAWLDMADVIANRNHTFTAGDVFQVLKIPADSLVIAAGAEVVTAFDGTTPSVDIDFAAGDDMVDGGDVTSTGWLAGGTNGQGLVIGGGAANAFTQLVTTTDTIDVVVNAGANDVTTGVLRVVALVARLEEKGFITGRAKVATRDALA